MTTTKKVSYVGWPVLFLVVGTIATLGTAQSPRDPGAEPKGDEKPIVVPFELLRSRHMAVQVKVNGKGPYRLIFDTGAPTNLINNKLAKEAGVLKKDEKPAIPLFGMGGAKVLDSLEISGAKLENVPVMVMDHPTVTAISKALGPIDGLVGFPFFARYKTTVDYQKRELTLVPNGYQPADPIKGLMEKISRGSGKQPAAVVGPAALWGFTVDEASGDDGAGVTVTSVLAGSAAAEGGLKPGDRLLTLDGRWTDSLADTLRATSLVKPGRSVEVVVRRDGKEVKLTVTPVKGL